MHSKSLLGVFVSNILEGEKGLLDPLDGRLFIR